MTTTTDQTQQVFNAVATTLQSMAPVVINAVAQGAAASTPQGAALMIGATILEALIQAQAAGAPEIISMYNALGSVISSEQTAIDNAALGRIPALAQHQAA